MLAFLLLISPLTLTDKGKPQDAPALQHKFVITGNANLGYDFRLYIMSKTPIKTLKIHNLQERYDFYSEKSPDGKMVEILLYTTVPELEVIAAISETETIRLKIKNKILR